MHLPEGHGVGATPYPDTVDLPRNPSSLWFDVVSPMFVAGDGVFMRSDTGWRTMIGPLHIEATVVRGLHHNDLFVGYSGMYVTHYNGRTWSTVLDFRGGDFAPRGIAVLPHAVWVVGGHLHAVAYRRTR